METTTIGGTSYPVDYAYDRAGRVTRLTYPHNADATRSWVDYTYDAVGRTATVKDAATTFAAFSHHADDLLKDVTFGNGVVRSNAYNGRGWPTSIQATYGAATYLDLAYSSYDASGNVLTIGGSTQPTQSFTYDKLDRLRTASGSFPSLTYIYDALGNRLQEDRGVAATYTLRPNGNGGTVQWSPSGCTVNFDCVKEATSDGDATQVVAGTIGLTDLYAIADLPDIGSTPIDYVEVSAVARSNFWEPPPCFPGPCPTFQAGRGGASTDAGPMASSDAIYLRVNGYRGGLTSLGADWWTYSSRWYTNPATGQPWTAAEVNALEAGVEVADVLTMARVTQLFVTVKTGLTTTYAYANGATGMNTLTSLTKGGATTSFAYDANGNLLSKTGGWSYDWNPENLMAVAKLNGVQQQAYTYDGLGRRVKVEGTTSSTWTVSIVSGMNAIYEKDQSGAVTKYVYANGMRIAKITSSGAVQYYLGDHLGSTRKVLDANRNAVFSAEYEPFGKPYAVTGTESYKYTMEKHDDPTGLVYLRARQYDPDIGRFVSADSILGSGEDPQSHNRYAYVGDNPLSRTDPTGKFWNIVIGAIAGAVIGYVGCGIATGGWTSGDCAIAAGVGALSGAIAGATFGIGLAAGGAVASGLGLSGAAAGLTSAVVAGAISGAAAGAASYFLEGGAATATGREFDWSAEAFGKSVLIGAGTGAAFGAAGYVAGRFAPKIFRFGGERVGPSDDAALYWNKGTFKNSRDSLLSHLLEHGKGRTPAQYTNEALGARDALWGARGVNQGLATIGGKGEPGSLLRMITGSPGWRIKGPTGGIYDFLGRVVTFWG